MRTYLTHTEYCKKYIEIYSNHNMLLQRQYCRYSVCTWSMHDHACIMIFLGRYQHPSPFSGGFRRWIPERFDQYLLLLHDQRCFENPSGSWRTIAEVRWTKYPLTKETPRKTRGGGFNPFESFGCFEGKGRHVMSCCAAWWKKFGSITSGSKVQFGILPSWSSIKKPLQFNKSLWPTPGFLGYFQSSQERKINVRKNAPAGCWFQPIWKILISQMGIFPNFRAENSKNIWVATTFPGSLQLFSGFPSWKSTCQRPSSNQLIPWQWKNGTMDPLIEDVLPT